MSGPVAARRWPWGERTTWAYDGGSRLATLTLGNGATVTYAYDAASRTTGVQNAKADGTVIAGYVYTRDAVGNPTGVSLSDGNLVSFSYDDTYRLTREQRSGAAAYDITYSYDATGNRTGKLTGGVTTTYTVDAADRLTLEDAGGALTTYSYDPAGNNTLVNAAGALTTYTWDLTNRMTGLADASGVTTLVYDATGLRRSKQDSAGTTGFLWDGQTLLLEADGGGATQAHYTAGPGGYGPTVAQRRGTTSSFYHPTDLGTIENLTDASGDVTDSYAFTAFGVPVATSGTTVNPFRYVGALGYYTDPTTGLSYVRARYLRPTTGSWLSVDPVQGEPRYQYVGGRATWGVDASGLIPRPEYLKRVLACRKQYDKCLSDGGSPIHCTAVLNGCVTDIPAWDCYLDVRWTGTETLNGRTVWVGLMCRVCPMRPEVCWAIRSGPTDKTQDQENGPTPAGWHLVGAPGDATSVGTQPGASPAHPVHDGFIPLSGPDIDAVNRCSLGMHFDCLETGIGTHGCVGTQCQEDYWDIVAVVKDLREELRDVLYVHVPEVPDL